MIKLGSNPGHKHLYPSDFFKLILKFYHDLGPNIHTQGSVPGARSCKRRVRKGKFECQQRRKNPVTKDCGLFCKRFRCLLSWFIADASPIYASAIEEQPSAILQ